MRCYHKSHTIMWPHNLCFTSLFASFSVFQHQICLFSATTSLSWQIFLQLPLEIMIWCRKSEFVEILFESQLMSSANPSGSVCKRIWQSVFLVHKGIPSENPTHGCIYALKNVHANIFTNIVFCACIINVLCCCMRNWMVRCFMREMFSSNLQMMKYP